MHLAASYLETLRDLLRKALEELDGELDDNYGIGCAERYGHADDDNHAWYVAARDACGFKEKP